MANQQQKSRRRQTFFLTLVAISATASYFYSTTNASSSHINISTDNPNSSRNLMSLDQFSDPKSVEPSLPHNPSPPTTVTVIYFDPDWHRAHYLSIFSAGTLERFGTGRVKFTTHHHRQIRRPQSPCLAVFLYNKDRPDQFGSSLLPRYVSNYGHCKTLVTADEFCHKPMEFDSREYYTSEASDKTYVPLGPRRDSWESFQKIAARSPTRKLELKPASQRRFKMNGIFRKTTNVSRYKLSQVIENNERLNYEWNVYAQISKRSEGGARLETDEYVQILLESTFTLAPNGHNPECYRLFEAVEAGSIPIIVLDESYYEHPCKESLGAWVESPAVVLHTWDDLYPWVEHFLDNPLELDKRQREMMEWYEVYMRMVVADFESVFLDADDGGSGDDDVEEMEE